MPARKSARRTRSKKFKDCSKRGKSSCRRSTKCSYRRSRSPRCQPKKSRSKSSRSRRHKKEASKLGALLTESEVVERIKAHRCSAAKREPGKLCADQCTFDVRLGCIPTAFVDDKIGRFLSEGKRDFSFRSKKPAFSFSFPLTIDTLLGDYSGAIRFSPQTGRLVLCYGPIITESKLSTRPLLATIVRDSLATNLWNWYQSSGRHLQRKSAEQNVDALGNYFYADIYGLPGAFIKLEWQEAMWLDKFLDTKFKQSGKSATEYHQPKSLNELCEPPIRCPGILDKHGVSATDVESDCFARGERSHRDKTLSDLRKQRISGMDNKDVKDAMLHDFDPFTSGDMSKKHLLRRRLGLDIVDDLDDLDYELIDEATIADIESPSDLTRLLMTLKKDKKSTVSRPVAPIESPSFTKFEPSNVSKLKLGGGAAFSQVHNSAINKKLIQAAFVKRAKEDFPDYTFVDMEANVMVDGEFPDGFIPKNEEQEDQPYIILQHLVRIFIKADTKIEEKFRILKMYYDLVKDGKASKYKIMYNICRDVMTTHYPSSRLSRIPNKFPVDESESSDSSGSSEY